MGAPATFYYFGLLKEEENENKPTDQTHYISSINRHYVVYLFEPCRPQQRGRIRGCRKNSNDLRYHERKGDIAVADGEVMAEVPVKVKTADGMTTIDAVMEAFHKEYKPDGYLCDQFVSKLWGIETSNTLFFINNLSITSGVKSEPVKNGDRIIASVNADDKYYSDYFSYFGKTAITGITGGSVTLCLQGFMGMTQNADPQAIPNAELGIVSEDGFQKLDGIVTDQDGKVVIQLDKDTFQAGKTYYLSARGTVPTTATDWNTAGNPAVNVDGPR